MTFDRDNPYLLTPGPLTTSAATKQAMARDWGSRDRRFIALTGRVRDRLTALAGGGEDHSAVLLQGSGTFAVEAMLGTLRPPTALSTSASSTANRCRTSTSTATSPRRRGSSGRWASTFAKR